MTMVGKQRKSSSSMRVSYVKTLAYIYESAARTFSIRKSWVENFMKSKSHFSIEAAQVSEKFSFECDVYESFSTGVEGWVWML